MSAFKVVTLCLLFMQIAFGIYLFAHALPRRRHGRWLVLALLLFYAVAVLVGAVRLTSVGEGMSSFGKMFLFFTAYLWACLGLVMVGTDSSFWAALFCTTAGYTTQNLASGLDGLVKLLALRWYGLDEYVPTLWVTSFVLCSLVVYVPTWMLFARQVDASLLNRRPHRGMLGIICVVMLVVILFDVMNKMLPLYDVPLALICVNRIVHGTTCAFVLYAEYEMLFNRQLMLNMATTEQMLEERGRQYELARDTIADVNRRVHDIRHAVLRELDGAGVERETLVAVAHEVEVYDSGVMTGNEALDTVLSEKRLSFLREGVELSCIADGTALEHLPAADTYVLAGTALDESLACALAVEDPSLRTVSLSLRKAGDMASLHLEGFCGVGMSAPLKGPRSAARLVAERHGGVVAAHIQGAERIFVTDVAIPLP